MRFSDLLVRVEPFVLDDGRTVVSRPVTTADLAKMLDYQAAARKLNEHLAYWENTGMIAVNSRAGVKLAVVEIVDAALVGFHPQPEEDER